MKTLIFALLLTVKLSALDVLVSIPPIKYFVEAVGGDLVQVESLLPPGAGPHTFEPSPRQMATAASAKLWFGVGESFERQVAAALPRLPMVNLTQGIPLMGGCPHCAQGGDPHIWMSPTLAKQFSRVIANELTKQLPDSKGIIEANLKKLDQSLDQLNRELKAQLAPCSGETLLVSHPAFGYFCRDYDLHQLSIEFEGKEPTPRQLLGLLAQAKEQRAKLVILDGLHGAKGANLVAKELDLPTCTVNPMKEDVPQNLRQLAGCICGAQHG